MRKFLVNVNGTQYQIEVEELDKSAAAAPVAAPAPAPAPVSAPKPVAAPAPVAAPTPVSGSGTAVNSPMPGNILSVNVAVGDAVKAGQTLMMLEAMKMENEILSPIDGKVIAISVSKGTTVGAGQLLCTVA